MNQPFRPLWIVLTLVLVAGLAPQSLLAKKSDDPSIPPGSNPGDPSKPAAPAKPPKLPPEQRALNALREQLEVADDAEWQALTPRILRVQTLARRLKEVRDRKVLEARKASREAEDLSKIFPPEISTALETLGQRAQDLRTARDVKGMPAQEIQTKLANFREARTKAEGLLLAELAKARQELRELLTAHQEVVLTVSGVLD